jgi:hypothetical protein
MPRLTSGYWRSIVVTISKPYEGFDRHIGRNNGSAAMVAITQCACLIENERLAIQAPAVLLDGTNKLIDLFLSNVSIVCGTIQ